MVKTNYDPIKSLPGRSEAIWLIAIEQFYKEAEAGLTGMIVDWTQLTPVQKREYFVGAEIEYKKGLQ